MTARARSTWIVVALVATAAALAAVAWFALRPDTAPTPPATTPGDPAPSSTAPSSPTPPTPSSPPPDPLAGWTLEQKVGQLLMVGVDVGAPQQVSYDAVTGHHVGNVFLAGRSEAGVAATRDLVDGFTRLVSPETTQDTPLVVATDQEGGYVQVLRGPGFSQIPTALAQSGRDPAALREDATGWGAELAEAGITLNLAPVMDLVPEQSAAQNPPIGYVERAYGYTPETVTSHATAFSAGMEASGVDVTIKHFPGLGRVTRNTDTDAGVTDDVTTRDDPSVEVFAAGIDAGAAFVMTSTAVYTRIDPDLPAAFSPVVVEGMLRDDLGFEGVVLTDDVSAAAQVQPWTPAERAVLTVEAGGDMVLASADPTVVAEMADALVERASGDPAFAAKVDAAVLRVLAAKERLG
ncbi:glycoside hydrolase family 3 N-terminal domain-containing protein [Cellulosimicrobium marinum]|uniref:glycoside hydrolase family 3 N-terminal domain-containing protein n=1 Tax=Cellulosimicrobium marinum TaxID=1638992 RepID=UPI001E5A3364|nr:glycoside hydrolase family 3 N-terminal domain-containing protein [Cellulosimicrobium marinum]MCB7136010.1 glycoside hydrolase family 3 protein [Cellulosimicrobium marinum]